MIVALESQMLILYDIIFHGFCNVSISTKYSSLPKTESSNIIMFNALTEEFGDFYCDQGI